MPLSKHTQQNNTTRNTIFFIYSSSFFIYIFSETLAFNPKSENQDHGSTLQVFHIFSSCSPFKPSKPLSWEQTVLEQQAKDQARVQYLSNLAVAKKSVVPIASGRQIIQSPTSFVRAKIGSPPQTLLMAMYTSNDAAWIPCSGCVGCPSSAFFDPSKSSSFKNLSCADYQCKRCFGIGEDVEEEMIRLEITEHLKKVKR